MRQFREEDHSDVFGYIEMILKVSVGKVEK